MIKCNNCGDTSPYDAKFCIGCGKLIPNVTIAATGATVRLRNEYQLSTNASGAPYINPFIDYSDLDTDEPLYFIYKADLGGLLKDASTYVKQTERGYDIYYHGRKIVFID